MKFHQGICDIMKGKVIFHPSNSSYRVKPIKFLEIEFMEVRYQVCNIFYSVDFFQQDFFVFYHLPDEMILHINMISL